MSAHGSYYQELYNVPPLGEKPDIQWIEDSDILKMTIAIQSILSSLSMPDPDHDHCNHNNDENNDDNDDDIQQYWWDDYVTTFPAKFYTLLSPTDYSELFGDDEDAEDMIHKDEEAKDMNHKDEEAKEMIHKDMEAEEMIHKDEEAKEMIPKYKEAKKMTNDDDAMQYDATKHNLHLSTSITTEQKLQIYQYLIYFVCFRP